MKYPNETEEEFLARVEEAKSRGICIFRDDANREMINRKTCCKSRGEQLHSIILNWRQKNEL